MSNSDRLLFERVVVDGGPLFVVGTPVLTRETDGPSQRSGLEVYSVTSLSSQQLAIDELARSAWQTAALALPLAVALALLAARQVLRPVRELNTAARQLGDGKLGPRPGCSEIFGPPSKKNETGTCRIFEMCCRRLAPIRLVPFSYFCTC